MKLKIVLFLAFTISAFFPANAQNEATSDSEVELLNLPGDNLDLYAVLDLFQKSKTIEDFEETLNEEATGINNLDLNLDGEVDFIKVVTQQDKKDFAFVLQVDIAKEEVQDVAVILVSKDAEEKVSLQMVGDENLYGKDYVIEPKLETPSVTANPAYSGPDTTVVINQESTVVVVESAPIVHYVYSPVYVPYYPPYYYGYYPVYYRPYPVVSIHIYSRNHYHYHNRYHGGRYGRGGNNVIINNNNNYNNYNRTRNTSNTVNRNKSAGNYKKDNASRPSNTVKNNPSNGNKAGTNKPATRDQNNNGNRKENAPSGQTKPASKPATQPASKPASRPASKPASKPAAQPASKPATRPASKPAARPASTPARKPAGTGAAAGRKGGRRR